ncbi:alpha/beta hydrolase [Iodidimonas gelatinilytica]|uniref:Alpha/beta hydrolase n=2 Tax=Iodidimonas gelatinilytica TaxID=1236966 RepID=A0A5A7MZ46_9PROT|nr:alpha/beta hydrolase [Iodidimonas gelatinilytica]
MRIWGCVFMLLVLASCAPAVQKPITEEPQRPYLTRDLYVAADRAQLPYTQWPAPRSCAVVVALHGFNDYRSSFAWPGPILAQQGLSVFAYDQRGFGESAQPGLWAGETLLVQDALGFIQAVKARYPDQPIILLGESMGAAVALLTAQSPAANDLVDAVVLVSPAVWGWSEMPFFYRMSLWLTAHLAPQMRLTGRGLDRIASDNREALIAMGRDPFVIKETRVDAIYGLVELMQSALESAEGLTLPTLVMIGEQDQIVPVPAMQALVDALPQAVTETRIYEDGYHLLLQDHGRARFLEDVSDFAADRIGTSCKDH